MAGNPLPPWGAPSIEPKRKFKYQMTIGGIPAWSIITSSRPKYTITGGTTHKYLGHEFKFPGRVTYDDIRVTLVDMINVDVAGQLLKVIESAGYKRPNQWSEDPANYRKTFSKKAFVGTLGEIAIRVINGEGETAEKWTLKNAWISGVDFGDLNYGSEDNLNISITLVFDYADVEINQALLDAN